MVFEMMYVVMTEMILVLKGARIKIELIFKTIFLFKPVIFKKWRSSKCRSRLIQENLWKMMC